MKVDPFTLIHVLKQQKFIDTKVWLLKLVSEVDKDAIYHPEVTLYIESLCRPLLASIRKPLWVWEVGNG